MKTIAATFTVAATLLGTPHATAAQFARVKKFGGFESGKKFTLVVDKVVSTRQVGDGLPAKSRMPDGIAAFKRGQKVKFTIGKKGQLTGPGFKFAFESGGTVSNGYANIPTDNTPRVDTALVFKNARGMPRSASLSFFKVRVEDFETITYQVDYTFK